MILHSMEEVTVRAFSEEEGNDTLALVSNGWANPCKRVELKCRI